MLLQKTGSQRLISALEALPRERAAALRLSLEQGVTYRDIAVRLGQEPATVLRWLDDSLRDIAAGAGAKTAVHGRTG